MKVAIIGAGVAGLSIGWRLRQAGAEVAVLDRARPARAATWASAGMISVAGEMEDEASPEASFAKRSSALWVDFAKELEMISDRRVAYRTDGALLVARTDAAWEAYRGRTDGEPLEPARARARDPMLTPDIKGAFWSPDDAQVDNRALGDALAVAFVKAGGELVPNEAVARLEAHAGRMQSAVTPFRHIAADAYVLAAGAWSGSFDSLPPEALPPVRPVKGEMLAVAPSSGAGLPAHVIRDERVYLVPRHDRLLIGATVSESGFDTTVTDAAAEDLSQRAISLLPGVASWNIVERWAGLRPGSPDGLPILGESAIENLFVASGQYRNGILFAPAIAEHMSRLILRQTAEISAFSPRRFG
jgi:glycine oxidase